MRAGERGFTLVAVLLLLALCGLALAAVGPAWSAWTQREREQDVLRIGALYVRAIAEYRDTSPGTLKSYPDKLEWLLSDTRFVGTTRHIRCLYDDPMNPGKPWGLIKDDAGRILGVFSQSELRPFTQQRIETEWLELDPVQRYADWKFQPKAMGLAADRQPTPSSTSTQSL